MAPLLLAMCAGACAAASPMVTIRMEPESAVRGRDITLGQVAYLTTHDLDLLVRLAKLPLRLASVPGQATVVDRGLLSQRLAQAGIAPEQVAWRGPEATRVSLGKSGLSGEEIAQAAQASLRSWLVERGGHFELQLQSAPQPVRSDEGALAMRVRLPALVGSRDRAVMWVDVFSGDRHVRAVPVTFEVGTWGGGSGQTQLLPSRIAPGTVSPAAPVRRAVALMPGRESPAIVQIASTQSTEEGAVALLAVTRGQWASLRTSAGAVVLERRVEILQDARVGEQVRVRQPGAAGTLIARVTAPGQLEIQE